MLHTVVLYIYLLPQSRNSHYSKDSWFLLLDNDIRNQGLVASCVHCHWLVIYFKTSELAEYINIWQSIVIWLWKSVSMRDNLNISDYFDYNGHKYSLNFGTQFWYEIALSQLDCIILNLGWVIAVVQSLSHVWLCDPMTAAR